MLIHSITPPLKARPIITEPHPPSLPLEGPWVAIRILSGGCGLPTVTHPPEMQESFSPHGTLGRPLHGLQLDYGLSIDTL